MIMVHDAARIAGRRVLLLAALLATQAFAAEGRNQAASAEPHAGEYEPLVERLFASESAFAQETGELEVGTVFAYSRADGVWSAPLSLEVEYGLTARWQVAASIPFTWSSEEAAERGAVSAGVLYNVVPPAGDAAMSVALEVTQAESRSAGDDESSESGPEVELAVLLVRIYDDAEVHLSLGGARSTDDASELTFGAGAVLVTRALLPSIEITASHSDDAFAAYLTPGLHWRSGELELGLGLSIGLNSDSSELAGIAALTVAF